MASTDYRIRTREGRTVSQSEEVNRRIEEVIKLWSAARALRYNHEVQWQESALLLMPEWANTFWYGYDQWPGQKKTMQQIDITGMLAKDRYSAIVDSITTPFTDPWSKLQAGGPDGDKLMQRRRVRDYFTQLNRLMWECRYGEYGNFKTQNNQNYSCIGVFGNMHMLVDELDMRFTGGERGLRYRSLSPGEIYLVQNHQGMVTEYFRAFRRTAQQIHQQWPDTFPEVLYTALSAGSQQKYWIIQYVWPRANYNPNSSLSTDMPYGSLYISMEGHIMLEENGYHTFPLPTARWSQAPDEVNGRGVAQQILPSLKTLNAEKTIFLKQGHRAADPIYLSYDDTINFKSHPGAWNVGGMSKDGKRLIDILPTGEIQVSEEMMAEERRGVNQGFLVDLFQLAWENKNATQMSARQVIEFLHDRGTLVSPSVGRLHDEYLGALLHREMAVLAYLGLLPDMPPELREAGAKYKVVYTSPFYRALRASKVAGYLRFCETMGQIAQITQEPEGLDIITAGMDRAASEIADDMGDFADWLATPQELAQKRQQRQQAAQREDQIKAMPAQAAIIKAQAIQAKAQTGGNIGGALSGTAPGQNPQVPGNQPGTPGQPSVVPGQPGLPGQPPQ